MKIFGIHDRTACAYYRIKLPMQELARHGHMTKWIMGRDMTDAVVMDIIQNWPIAVLQRTDKIGALPYVQSMHETTRIVYELDDDVFNIEPSNTGPWVHYSKPEARQTVSTMLRDADLVTVTTDHLADAMAAYSKNIAVLPNFISEKVFSLPPADLSQPVVGWVGGSSHAQDLAEAAAPALRRFLDRTPSWSVRLGGFDFSKEVRHSRVEVTPWVAVTDDDLSYYRTIDFSIGIAPLMDASAFNRSKSYLKALEYAARGIPCIATDSDPYHGFIKHGETGFLVKQHHEWGRYLHKLASDQKLREEMGRNAREHAREFTIEANWRMWADAYGKVLR